MRELIGVGKPNDFSNFVLRARLSKKYGLFGRIPMWGGMRLHEFYPPLSTILVRFLNMRGALIAYFIFIALIWTLYRGPLVAILFLISLYHWDPLLFTGRYSELLGYSIVSLAVFSKSSVLSGILLGLAGLAYPVSLLFGSILLIFRADPLIYIIAFFMCGWWYVPFFLKRKKLSYLKEKRKDKKFGLYLVQYTSMVNLACFLFGPLWLCLILGLGLWLLPISVRQGNGPHFVPWRAVIKRIKYFFLSQLFWTDDLVKAMPALVNIKEKSIIVKEPAPDNMLIGGADDGISGSFKRWVWAIAAYLIEKDIVVYNGLPSTEVPVSSLVVPEGIREYSVNELGLKSQGD